MAGVSHDKAMTSTVRPVMLLPFDPAGSKIGGIRTFADGFIADAPDDFEPIVVGATESSDLPLGALTSVRAGNRTVAFLPIVRVEATGPIAVRFSLALMRHRGQLQTPGSVLQVHRPGTDLAVLPGRRPRVRVIHNTSADLSSGESESQWRRLPGMLDLLDRLTLRRMDVIYAVGDRAFVDVTERYPHIAGRVRSITNWYDERLFRPPTDQERAESRASIGVEPDTEVVVFAGRLERQKNPLLLAEAFARLAARRTDARLVVIGDGGMRTLFEQRLDELALRAKVTVIGAVQRPRVAELLRAADVLCITSSFETGPTVGLEALGSGLAVVTTPVGQVSHIVRRDAAAGAVVDEGSPAAIAGALAAVLDVPRARREQAAMAIAAPYSAHRVLEPLYEDHRRLARQYWKL